jgi:hypothetical protein
VGLRAVLDAVVKYKVKMVLKETGCEGEEWLEVAQYRVQWRTFQNTVMNTGVLHING